jgi:phage baseplate assembly protein gpV
MGDFSLSGLAQSVVERFAGDLHTCLPARIISLSYDLQKATVQPMIKARYTDGDGDPEKGVKEMASIPSVPLVFMGSKHATMTFPVAVGDLVLVFFSERSIDAFKYSDGKSPIDPKDLRMHDYSDAFALCGMFTYPTALGIHPTNTVIRMNAGQSNESKLSFQPDGNIVFDSSSQLVINTQHDTIINAQGNAIVNANSAIINCDSTINGDLRVEGDVSISGTSSAQDHLSSGISGASHTHPFKAKIGTDNLVTNAPS